MNRVLIVSADNRLCTDLGKHFFDANYETVDIAENGVDALSMHINSSYDLILTEFHLEDMNGVQLLRLVKKFTQSSGGLLLYDGHGLSEAEYLELLDDAVDLYLRREAGPNVTMAFAAFILEKVKAKRKTILLGNDIEVDVNTRTVKRDDKIIDLTRKEYAILELLMKNMNQSISRKQIIEEIWNESDDDTNERVVDVHIKKLREKVGAGSIISVRKTGYMWRDEK